MGVRPWMFGVLLAAGIGAGYAWLSGRPLARETVVTDAAPLSVPPAARQTLPESEEVRVLAPASARPGSREPMPALRVVRTKTPALAGNSNLLLVGLDRRPGASGGGRPDTIMVLSLSDELGHAGIVSIPRDLYLEIPGHGPDRINASFAVARRLKMSPTDLLERVVEDTLGLPIAHSVVVDLAGFEAAIDAIGGVDVDVPCAIADNFIDPRLPGKRRQLDVAAGRQHMDGATAAMYVRSRHGRSDWSRARRQQAVLAAVKRRLVSADGLTRLPGLLDQLREMVVTDMTRAEILALGARLLRVEPAKLHGVVIGYRETRGHRTPEGKSVLLPEPAAIQTKLARLFSADAPGRRPRLAACESKEVALEHRRGPNRPAAQALGAGGAPPSER